ncbi:hypothetical protein ACHAXT_008529 [Thalassiosira profunda]
MTTFYVPHELPSPDRNSSAIELAHAMGTPLSATMKACLATDCGDDYGANLCIKEDHPTPATNSEELDAGMMLIRVLACALAPGDVRLMTGKTDRFQLPPGGRPYIPGSDVAGIVVLARTEESKFRVGDYVVARFDEPKPNGGLAEYRMVKTWLSEVCPESIPPTVACGLPASAMAAKRVVGEYVKPNQRVLVLGGSGAVGSSMIQYAKNIEGVTVIAVSTQQEICKSLGADLVLDYRTTKWWQATELTCDEDHKVDVVLDMVNGKENWPTGACSGKAIKRGGVYASLITGVETEIDGTSLWKIAKFMSVFAKRKLQSKLLARRGVPRWAAPEALKLEDGDLTDLFQDVVEGRLKPLVDPASPFPFIKEGVVEAFELQRSKHAHGKVVITIAEK